MSVFRDEKRIAELLEQIGGIETPVSEDIEERMISGLEGFLASGHSGGGAEDFIVTVSQTEEQGVVKYRADKTVKQIYEARMDGKNVKAVTNAGTYMMELLLTAYSGSLACFSTAVLDSETSNILVISALGMGGGESIEDDSWEVADNHI